MTSDELKGGWRPDCVGREIVVLAETSSTNTVVLEAAADGSRTGLVVLADLQTAGRGRLGRTWLSPRGASVLCSVLIISPEQGPDLRADGSEHVQSAFQGGLTLAAAVGACQAIRQSTEITPAIKWPNDLRISNRKVGGILIESRRLDGGERAWAVGIGINCLQHEGHFPPELRGQATSLEMEASHAIDRVQVARALLQCWDRWLPDVGQQDLEAVHSAWLEYAEPIGQRVHLLYRGREYTGTTVAVTPSGGLIVQGDDGRQAWFDPMQTTLL